MQYLNEDFVLGQRTISPCLSLNLCVVHLKTRVKTASLALNVKLRIAKKIDGK